MPRVSVVIPAYNHEKYVAEAIQSVLDQTYQDFEIIITDDASSDNTVAEIKKFKDPRIKLFRFEKNQGGSAAVNNCIKHAKGEYIANLSSDDAFLPDKLEKQVKFLDNNKKIGAVFGYAKIIDDDGEDFTNKNHFYYNIFKQPNRTRSEWLNHFFYKGNCLCHPSMLIREECYEKVGLYDPRYAQLPDFDMWIRLCMEYEIYVMQENLIKFRIRKGELNVSGTKPETAIRHSIEFMEILKNFTRIKFGEDLAEIFPITVKNATNIDPGLLPFFIYNSTLENKNLADFEYKYFAINGLFQLLKNGEIAEKIKTQYGFDYQDLIRITGQYKIISSRSTWTQLFINTGNGFNENESIIQTLSGEETELVFNIENYQQIKQLRFDPISDFAIVQIQSINIIDSKNVSHNISNYKSNAHYKDDNKLVFATNDPRIYGIDLSAINNPKKVVIKLSFIGKSADALANVMDYNNQQIISRDIKLHELTGEIKHRNEAVHNLEGEIQKRNEVVNSLNQEIEHRNEAINSLNETIKHRDEMINSLGASIGNLGAEIEKRSKTIDNLNKTIEQGNTAIDNLGREIQEKNKSIDNLNQEIKQRNEAINSLNAEIDQRNKNIKNLEEEIAKRNSLISEKETVIFDLNKNKEILEEQRRALETTLSEKNNYIASIEPDYAEFQIVKKSLTHKFLVMHRKISSYFINSPRRVAGKLIRFIASRREPIKHTNSAYELKISIITSLFNADKRFLAEMVESILNQTYSNWELCISDGGNAESAIKEMLKQYAEKDSRIKVSFLDKDKGIVDNFNEALSLATGDFIALLDHNDILEHIALFEVVKAINENPDADFLYSDEDKISEDSKKMFEPNFKPDWSPDMLRSTCYTGNLMVIKMDLIKQIGFFRKGYDEAEFYDLALRASEAAKTIIHIPKILYHKRGNEDVFDDNSCLFTDGKKLKEKILKFSSAETPKANHEHKIMFSIIILNKNAPNFIIPLLESLKTKELNEYFEVMVGDTGTTDKQVLDYYEKNSAVIKIVNNLKYHFSKNYNCLIKNYARGKFLGIVNNDIILSSTSFLHKIDNLLSDSGIGAVGTRLVYENGTLQHGGVFFMKDGPCKFLPYHRLHRGNPKDLPKLETEFVPAVTGAFLFCRKEDFIDVGGFDENYEEEAQDIDLCLKFKRNGKQIALLDAGKIIHIENGTRPKGSENLHDREYLLFRWKSLIEAIFVQPDSNNNIHSKNKSLEGIKILFLTCVYKPKGYGIALAMKKQIEGLVEHGAEVFIASPNTDVHSSKGVTIFPVGMDYQGVKNIMLEIKPDITIAYTPPYYSHIAKFNDFETIKVAYDNGEPYSSFFDEEEAEARRSIDQDKYRAISKFHIHIGCSEFIKKSSGIKNSVALHDGSEHIMENKHREKTNIRKMLGLKENSFIISSMARIGIGEDRYKGFDVMEIIKEKTLQKLGGGGKKEVVFLVVGHLAPGGDKVKKRLENAGFRVVPDAADELKADILSQSDIFVSPSLWEGFNLPLVEAQYCGTPSLAFSIGAHPEVCPFHFDTAEELVKNICRQYENGKYHEWCGTVCKTYVTKKFRWKKHVDKLISTLYDTVKQKQKNYLATLKYWNNYYIKEIRRKNEKRAIEEHMKRMGIDGIIEDGISSNTYKTNYIIKNTPLISIIIPAKDKVDISKKCIESILEKTDYPNYKILIVDNASEEAETVKYYKDIQRKNSKISVVTYNKPFNFSAINNYAVSRTDSDYILFLNNDVEVINKEWLRAMLEHAQRKEVGAVGAKLYYPDKTIQHAGVIVGIKGVAGHSHRYLPGEKPGYSNRLRVAQNLSAVTAACLMTKKKIFNGVGGFDEQLPVAFNDVDLCLKIRQSNYLIVWTPFAELYHHECMSRGRDDTPEKLKRFGAEVEYFRKKWGDILDKGDPYYNPNLTLNKEDFSLK